MKGSAGGHGSAAGQSRECAAHQPPSPQSGHRDARDANSCAPPFLLPQHKLASITTRTSPSQLQRREIMRTDWLTVLGIPILAERKWSGEEGRKQGVRTNLVALKRERPNAVGGPSLISATPEMQQ